MENRLKKAIIKKIQLYSTILMLSTTPIVFTGCSDQIVKEPTKIEISNEEEILSSNDISSNTISSNTISENNIVSSNTISENTVVSEAEPEKEIPDARILSEEEKQTIRFAVKDLYENIPPPENGIYSQFDDFDFDNMHDGKFKEYESCKKQFMFEYNTGYTIVCGEDNYYNGTDYFMLVDGNFAEENVPFCMAKVDIISIIYQSSSNKFWIITNYQGETAIEPNTYVDMVNNNLIDEEITDFTVTPMRDYLEKKGFDLHSRGISTSSAQQMERSLFNKSKTR